MAIMRWDPFGEMLRMQREADRMFSRMGTRQMTEQGEEPWMPRIDIKRAGDDMQIRAELPGMKPEDVDIEVSDGVLTIKGERKQESESEDEGWLVRESSFGSFMRSVALPESVDPGTITADYHDGVLEMKVPKAFEQVQPKSTKISVGSAQPAQAMTGGSTPAEGQAQQPESEKGKWTESESTQSTTEADREKLKAHQGVSTK